MKTTKKLAALLLALAIGIGMALPAFAESSMEPVITASPDSVRIRKKETAQLSVTATAPEGGTLSYEWYEVRTTGNKIVEGATGPTFSIAGSEVMGGNITPSLDMNYYVVARNTSTHRYYYVVVTNTYTNEYGETWTATTKSETADVTAFLGFFEGVSAAFQLQWAWLLSTPSLISSGFFKWLLLSIPMPFLLGYYAFMGLGHDIESLFD